MTRETTWTEVRTEGDDDPEAEAEPEEEGEKTEEFDVDVEVEVEVEEDEREAEVEAAAVGEALRCLWRRVSSVDEEGAADEATEDTSRAVAVRARFAEGAVASDSSAAAAAAAAVAWSCCSRSCWGMTEAR